MMMTNDERDSRAGEYVLGTLSADERAAVEREPRRRRRAARGRARLGGPPRPARLAPAGGRPAGGGLDGAGARARTGPRGARSEPRSSHSRHGRARWAAPLAVDLARGRRRAAALAAGLALFIAADRLAPARRARPVRRRGQPRRRTAGADRARRHPRGRGACPPARGRDAVRAKPGALVYRGDRQAPLARHPRRRRPADRAAPERGRRGRDARRDRRAAWRLADRHATGPIVYSGRFVREYPLPRSARTGARTLSLRRRGSH